MPCSITGYARHTTPCSIKPGILCWVPSTARRLNLRASPIWVRCLDLASIFRLSNVQWKCPWQTLQEVLMVFRCHKKKLSTSENWQNAMMVTMTMMWRWWCWLEGVLPKDLIHAGCSHKRGLPKSTHAPTAEFAWSQHEPLLWKHSKKVTKKKGICAHNAHFRRFVAI